MLRRLIPQYCGSEVMTEGDAFILAFHEETDALLYCLHTQEALLQAPWPPAILDHENAAAWKTSQELSACFGDPRYEYMHAHLSDRLFARNNDLVRSTWSCRLLAGAQHAAGVCLRALGTAAHMHVLHVLRDRRGRGVPACTGHCCAYACAACVA